MKRSITTAVLSLLALGMLAGCGSESSGGSPTPVTPTQAKYVDTTSKSIYGKLSDFSKPADEVKAGDELTFKVTPSKYFNIEKITNNGKACQWVSDNEDGSSIYKTTIVAGTNKLAGAYSVDPTVDFVDEFKLDISDDVFNTVIGKAESAKDKGNREDLDFRRSGIEKARAPFKYVNGVKTSRASEKDAPFLNYVDGDTTHCETNNLRYTVKIRYLGIDTPESTSEIEEWGLSASYYSKYIYSGEDEYKKQIEKTTDFTGVQSGMSTIILVSQNLAKNADKATVGDLEIGNRNEGKYHTETDGNQRDLAYVWYATVDNPKKEDFRCLNLEMVYQGFSFGNGSVAALGEYYFKMFDAATLSAQANKRHRFSDLKDNNYYYYEEKGVSELTLETLYKSAPKDDTIGYKPESVYANKKTLYKIKGYVSRKVGTSFYMQDKPSYDNAKVIAGTEKPYGIYIFTYSETPIRVGDYVEVVGAVSTYGGTFQIQGISYQTINPDPVRDTKIISRDHEIVPIKITGAQFNKLMLPQVLVEITDNVWFYDFLSTYDNTSIAEGGSEEVNKYNKSYPFYNTSNSPIFYASYGEQDNTAAVAAEGEVRYSNSVIRFTVDQEILVTYGTETCYSYRFFTGGEYWYNPAGADYASEDYTPEKLPDGAPASEAVKYQAVKRSYKRKAAKPESAGHGLIVISHGYESTGGNTKMNAKICSGSQSDIFLEEVVA